MAKNLITPVIDYDQILPQEIEDRIKPLEHPVVLRWFETHHVKAMQGNKENGYTMLPSERVGQQSILSHWNFVFKNRRYDVGFFNGYDTDMNPQFHAVTFEDGVLRLNPEVDLHKEIWRKIQLHPFFENNVLGLRPKTGVYRFSLDDVVARQQKELERIKLSTKAKSDVLELDKDEQKTIMVSLGCETELDLLRFAEENPSAVLAAIKNLSVISVRELVESCFNEPYGLFVTDVSQNAILWAEGRKPVFTSSDNTVNLPEAFTYYLMGLNPDGKGKPEPSKEAKAKLKTIRQRVEEIDKELQAAKEAKKALAKETAVAPVAPSVEL